MALYIRRLQASSSFNFPSRLSVFSATRHSYSTQSYRSSSSSEISPADVQSAQKYCSELVQKYDSPSHVLLAFIPPSIQPAYLALKALNLEIARIPDTTSTAVVSAMRYQFWRDNIDRALSLNPPKQPVSILLSAAMADLSARTDGKAKLSKSWFTRMIAAREHYSDGRPYTTSDALEKYAEDTYSTLLYLTVQALPMTSLTADHIASHIGKAMGITAVLRGLPLLAFPEPAKHHSNSAGLNPGLQEQRSRSQQGSVTLPLDVMARCGVKEEDVLRKGAEAPGLRDAVFEVATRASDHLITARQMVKSVQQGQAIDHDFEHEDDMIAANSTSIPQGQTSSQTPSPSSPQNDLNKAFGILMPALSTQMWLDRLQKHDFDIFRPELRQRDWKLPFKAFWAYRRRMF